jgi:hypothetical protein
LRLKMLRFTMMGVIDDELSRAVVAYIRGAGLAWPHRSLEAVAEAMGADAAERLGRAAADAGYQPRN